MAQLTCSACGAPLPAGAMFCGECGRSVSPAALAPAVPPPAELSGDDDGPPAHTSQPAGEAPISPAPISPAPISPAPISPAPISPAPISPPPGRSEPTLIAPPAGRSSENPYATGDLSALRDPTGSLRMLDAGRRADTTDLSDSRAYPSTVDAGDDDDADGPHGDPDEQPRCEACGATMGAHDIFCGECGHVSGTVSRAFGRDTASVSPGVVDANAVTPREPRDATADPGAAPHDDLEATRIVAPSRGGQRFILQFSTGESVTAHGSGLVGRNPIPEPGEYFDQLVRVLDPTRSVSKTHLEFGQDAGSFWVRDRFSGNGSILREPDAAARRCDPGKRYPVVRGTRIDLGEQFVVIS